MTPEEKAKELIEEYGSMPNALKVCITLYWALTRNPYEDSLQLSQENKIDFWWKVLLELGYDC